MAGSTTHHDLRLEVVTLRVLTALPALESRWHHATRPAVTFVLTDVQITADGVSDGGESVEMAFRKICETAHAPDGDIEACWNLVENN